jgi:hypothetical protein
LTRVTYDNIVVGGVDVFFYTQVSHHHIKNQTDWDGSPLTYQPYPGDTRQCKLISNHPIFQIHTGNRVLCLAEHTFQLSNFFIRDLALWKEFKGIEKNPFQREHFLQQEYGKYKANFAAKVISCFQVSFRMIRRPLTL